MPGRRLIIHRDEHHVFVFARRERLSGHEAAQVSDRCLAVLAGFQGYRFLPAHEANVFAWVIEFASLRNAASFVRALRVIYHDQSA